MRSRFTTGRANYKGRSNKWALCGVSKTHTHACTGKGRKCSLSFYRGSFSSPPPAPVSSPGWVASNGRGLLQRGWGEEVRDAQTDGITFAHLVCVTWCRMCCRRVAVQLAVKKKLRTRLRLLHRRWKHVVTHSCRHSCHEPWGSGISYEALGADNTFIVVGLCSKILDLFPFMKNILEKQPFF